MSRAAIEGKLRELTGRIQRTRQELAVLDEQLVVFREAAEETRLQALVDESPLSRSEHGEAQRHADAHARTRAKLAETLAELERSRDDLLDRLVPESS